MPSPGNAGPQCIAVNCSVMSSVLSSTCTCMVQPVQQSVAQIAVAICQGLPSDLSYSGENFDIQKHRQ